MPDRTEKQTRQQLIDAKLRLAGWNLGDPAQVTEELELDSGKAPVVGEPVTQYSGHRYADYGLKLKNRVEIILEAKRSSKDAELGKEQAFNYAKLVQKAQGGALPLLMYSNGHEHFFWDKEMYPPAKVIGFPTRDDLNWMIQRRETRQPLSASLINTDIAGREYQIRAIREVLERIEKSRKKMLLIMATGTGKTRTAVALVDTLMRAHWVRRVLFLVDRLALQEQALDAFKEHLPHEPRWPNEGEKTFRFSRRIYVTTYQSMINIIQSSTSSKKWISPFFFDLIIADESHRSIYDIYGQVLNYFNGIKLGLTATPTDQIDHDTFKLFDCEQGLPTFAYSYKEAVDHAPPYLCEFEVLKIRSRFQVEGIQGGNLDQKRVQQLIADGKLPEDIDFEGKDIERKVTNSGTNALILREFMEACIKDEGGVLPGKTIIFAVSKKHARRLVEIFDALYPEHKGTLARVLVSEDGEVHGKGGLLDRFKNQNFPRIAVSVDMLDTGVDIPELVNLVFAKPVYSFVKFWQMIGRGTRVLPEPHKRKPWCGEKDKFLIIDCWNNFDFFKMNPRGREPGSQEAITVKLFKSRLDLLEAASASGDKAGRQIAVRDIHASLKELPQNNILVSEAAGDLDALDEKLWSRLDERDLGFLRASIAPVLRAQSAGDFKSLKFQNDIVQWMASHCGGDKDRAEVIRQDLQEQIAELPLTVNTVKREEENIKNSEQDDWWREGDLSKVDQLTARLAPLMKLRAPRREAVVKLNLDDDRLVKEWVHFGPDHERLSTAAYRERVEALVESLIEETPVLQRISDGEAVSADELQALAAMLEQSPVEANLDRLRQAFANKKANLLAVLKHILGVERLVNWEEEVNLALDGFVAAHTDLNTLQLGFVDTLRTLLVQNGGISKAELTDQPFSQLHQQGILGVFAGGLRDQLVDLATGLSAEGV